MNIRAVELVGESNRVVDIAIAAGRISAVEPTGTQRVATSTEAPTFQLDGTLAFPGLTNSHDHLEFNLHRPLSGRRYSDYVEWGEHIHSHYAREIGLVESLPRPLRLRWGALKNILCGVTAVAHHGESSPESDLPWVGINAGTSIHSVRFAPAWRWRLLSPLSVGPLVFHLGEGTSVQCGHEIDAVIKWNVWRRQVVAVHGIAMDERQAGRFDAVVWCPVSNELLFGVTADVAALKRQTTILFGTDSTLSGGWNLWDHLRRAREIGALNDSELFDALTRSAARTWGLQVSGQIAVGCPADIVVARKKCPSTWDAFYSLDPEDLLLVVRRGRVLLADASIAEQGALPGLHRVVLGQTPKLVNEDVPALLKEIRAHGILPNLPLTSA